MAGLNKDIFRRIRTQAAQYEATTGRKISQANLNALYEAELSAQLTRSGEEARLGLEVKQEERLAGGQAQELDIKREEVKATKSAAKLQGAVNLASTGAQTYMVGKYLGGPAKGGPQAPPTSPGTYESIKSGVTGARDYFTGTTTPPPSNVGVTPTGELTGYGPAKTELSPITGEPVSPTNPAWGTGTVAAAGASPALYGVEGANYINTMALRSSAEAGVVGAGATGAPTAGMTAAQTGGLAVTGAIAVGTGVEAMRKAQGQEGYGKGSEAVAKVATKITPWNDESKAGMVLNVLTAPISATVGAVQMIENIVKPITGGRVICTELVRQGYMPQWLLYLDIKSCKKYIDEDTYNGYRYWADAVVRSMQKHIWVTKIVKPLALAWSYESAHLVAPKIKGSYFGKFLRFIGIPLCRFIGRVSR